MREYGVAVTGPAGALGPLTVRTALTAWQFAPVVSGILAVLVAGYVTGMFRVRRRHPARPWPTGRAAAFLAGLAVIVVATQSSVGAYDDVLFSDHMVQHVLLIMVAPPLLVAGRPVTLLLHAWGNPLHRWALRAVRSPVAAALTWPPAVTVLYCAVVAGTHTPPVMDLVLTSGAAHDGEHALYLVVGYLFFLPVVGSEPIRWRMSVAGRYLVMLPAMMVDSFTGIVFTFQSREIFAPYGHTGRAWGPSAVADLHLGGAVMFIGSDVAMTVVAACVTVRFFRDHRGDAGPAGVLPRQMTAAGATRWARDAGASVQEAELAAYNAYLSALGGSGDAHGRSGGAQGKTEKGDKPWEGSGALDAPDPDLPSSP